MSTIGSVAKMFTSGISRSCVRNEMTTMPPRTAMRLRTLTSPSYSTRQDWIEHRPDDREQRRRQAPQGHDDVVDALWLQRIQIPGRDVTAGEAARVRIVVDAGEQEAIDDEHYDVARRMA